jgi:hypothetical protein
VPSALRGIFSARRMQRWQYPIPRIIGGRFQVVRRTSECSKGTIPQHGGRYRYEQFRCGDNRPICLNSGKANHSCIVSIAFGRFTTLTAGTGVSHAAGLGIRLWKEWRSHLIRVATRISDESKKLPVGKAIPRFATTHSHLVDFGIRGRVGTVSKLSTWLQP